MRYAYEFTEQLPKLDIKSTQSYYLPELINRFFEISSLQKSLSKVLLDVPIAMLQILFGLILLSFYHPIFIVFSIALVLFFTSIILLTFRSAVQTSLNESDYKYKLAAWVQELARVLKSFKYSRNSTYHLEKSDMLTIGYLNSRTEHFKLLLFQYWILVAFKVIITFLMLSIGAYLLINQQLTIGQFIASEIVIITILASIEKLINSLEHIYDAFTSVEKLNNITDNPIEKNGKIIFDTNYQDKIIYQVKGLNFSFDGIYNVLNNLNFEINKNEKICILGKDGSGKSILLNLLSGIYAPNDGAVYVQNIKIQNYELDSLRDKIGLLTNKQDIFEGNLLDNITMGHNIPTQYIYHIAEQIGLTSFLQKLPNGLETVVQPLGNQLATSAIEKIILLRLLVQEYSILLMDEPWIRSEAIVQEKVKNYILEQINKTIIVVSNDREFASKCDKIIYLNLNGEIEFIGDWNSFKKLIS